MDATRHVVILAAEVADCARLIEANDDGSTDRLEAFRRNFVYPKLAEYNGRVLRAPGATLLAEFAGPMGRFRQF